MEKLCLRSFSFLSYLFGSMLFSSCMDTNARDAGSSYTKIPSIQERSSTGAYDNAFVLLHDGTGSAKKKYTIPPVTVEQVLLLVDRVAYNGGGILRMEGISDDARKAQTLKIIVPGFTLPRIPILPKKNNGDQDYLKKLEDYFQKCEIFRNDSIQACNRILSCQQLIKDTLTRYLSNYYRCKEKCSDIIGAMANSIRFLNGIKASNYVIILQGDQEHDMKDCKDYVPVTPKIPANYRLFQVTPNVTNVPPIFPCNPIDVIDSSSVKSFFNP